MARHDHRLGARSDQIWPELHPNDDHGRSPVAAVRTVIDGQAFS